MKRILKLAALAVLLGSLAFAEGTNSRESIFGKKKSEPEKPKQEPVKTETPPAETSMAEQAPAKPELAPEPSQVPETSEPEAAVASEFSFNDKDPLSGWAYTVVDRAEYRKGHLKAVMNGAQGTFGLYAVRDDGKEIPLLSSYDFFNSTAFMLRVGRKEYLLNYSGGIASEARQTEAGIQMVYTIPGKAKFLLDFTFPEDGITGGLEDTIRVTMYTVNLGQNPQTFTSKAIFDTILGESSSKHFLTYAIPELSTQRKFHSMKADRWVCSASNAAAIEFIFYGADITEPECVTLGPIGRLSDYWEPDAHEGKGFSTALSYNNSGVASNWKTSYLLPEQVDVKTFYIATAEGVEPVYAGRMPAGDELVEAIEAGEGPFPGDKGKPAVAKDEPEPAGTVPVTDETAPVVETAPAKQDGAGQPPQEEPSAPATQTVPEEVPSGKSPAEDGQLSEAAQAVREDQLDYEYIQNLIDYIESLQDEESIDEEELTSLNEELDAIFERLRSMGN